MKHLLSILFVSLFFVACKKDETPVEQPLGEQTIMNVSYGSDTVQRIDVYLPANRTTTATKAIVVIHGGGWISGNKVDMNGFIPVIKQLLPDYAIFNIGYRLGVFPSTNTFPTQENDVKAAVNFILNKAGEYKFNAAKTALLGASAGGHLALLQAYKNSSPKITAVVDFFGPPDMVALHNSYTGFAQLGIQALMLGSPATNPGLYQSSSPINFVTAQSSPTLILHGTADPLVPIAHSTVLKTKLETNGAFVQMVSYTGAGHGDWDNATYADAYQKIVAFLQAKNP